MFQKQKVLPTYWGHVVSFTGVCVLFTCTSVV